MLAEVEKQVTGEVKSSPIDVDAQLRSQPLNRNVIVLTVLLALVLIVDGFDIVLLAYLAPAISDQYQLGPLSMGLVLTFNHAGVALGGIVGGIAGDNLGRRPTLIIAVAGFAGGTLLCAVADTAFLFVVARMLAAVCMGAASPNIATLLVDMLPERWSGRLSFIAFAAYAVGSVICGLTANMVLPSQGWRAIFIIGGCAPLILLPLLLFFLPESPRFLVRKGRPPHAIAKALNSLAGSRSFSKDQQFEAPSEPHPGERVGLKRLIAHERGTLIGFGILAALLYFTAIGMTSTGTLILTAAGLSTPEAIAALLYHNIAGLAGAGIAVALVNRLGSRAVLLGLLVVSLTGLGWLSWIFALDGVDSATLTIALFTAVGFGLSSSLMLLYPVAAHAFPANIRASGTGMVTSMGRVGSIICSAVFGAILVGAGVAAVFALAALLVALTMVTVWTIKRHIAPVSQQ